MSGSAGLFWARGSCEQPFPPNWEQAFQNARLTAGDSKLVPRSWFSGPAQLLSSGPPPWSLDDLCPGLWPGRRSGSRGKGLWIRDLALTRARPLPPQTCGLSQHGVGLGGRASSGPCWHLTCTHSSSSKYSGQFGRGGPQGQPGMPAFPDCGHAGRWCF